MHVAIAREDLTIAEEEGAGFDVARVVEKAFGGLEEDGVGVEAGKEESG